MKTKLLLISLLAAFASLPLQAQTARMALVVFKKGTATVVHAGKESPAKVNDIIYEKDEIRTGKDGELSIQLASGVMMKVAPGSALVVEMISRDGKESNFALQLKQGSMLAKADREGKGLNMTIQSPTAIAGVRGTELIVDASPDRTAVLVNNGSVHVTDPAGTRSVDVEGGNKVVADTQGFQQGIMDAFEKQRFAILDQFEKEKRANFENVLDQIRRNRELIEGQRNKGP